MRWSYVPLLALTIVFLLFVLLNLQYYWLAILLMLGLILFALFYNPMHEVHKATFQPMKTSASKTKRKLKKKR
ncbi:MAG: hypothetical protein V1776_04475 [Candidatus Diapherotrites archaeon]